MHLHILGICGTFMGGLALLARAAGHRVTGCDANVYPPMSTQLAAQGIELIEGWNADQAALKPDVFVIGNVGTRGGHVLTFAKNTVVLSEAKLIGAGKLASLAGDHRDNELAGACFDPTGRYLFVNIQTPGITFAIWGPWSRGPL